MKPSTKNMSKARLLLEKAKKKSKEKLEVKEVKRKEDESTKKVKKKEEESDMEESSPEAKNQGNILNIVHIVWGLRRKG